ncbi:MAG: trypsin-like serine protease, partial [Bdellovibrionales bacterium]|nr:trypsin-like serine protease [Bdellovibrionales bacterium]
MKFMRAIVIAIVCTPLLQCSGGGGDSDGEDLSRNACPVLGLNSRIIQGTTCGESNSPVVEVTIVTLRGEIGLCSGTLLTSNDVLTAAHCFFDGAISAQVEVGNQSSTVAEVTNHPNVAVDPDTGATFNDVSILRLRTPLSASTLPVISEREIRVGDTVSIFGYGLNADGIPEVLRSGQMKVSGVDSEFIAAKFDGEGSNTCNGDSGGPAVLSYTSGETGVNGVIGVVSSGTNADCLAGDTTFFANLQ